MQPEPCNSPISAVAIDLDGTLLDSAPDLAAAANRTLRSLGARALPEARIRSMIGDGIDRLLQRCLDAAGIADPDPAERAQRTRMMRAFYRDDLFARGSIYPGVVEALKRWQGSGMTLACVTNKASELTLPLLREAGLEHYFERVYCADLPEQRKPAPAMLLAFMRDCAVNAASCVMIGDSSHDVMAARAAGVRAIAVTYGYGDPLKTRQAVPWLHTDRLDTLVLGQELNNNTGGLPC